jgi:hypothetical protein
MDHGTSTGIEWVLRTRIIYRCCVNRVIRKRQMLKIENVAPELKSCKECGILIAAELAIEFCKKCWDAYNGEEHHGG